MKRSILILSTLLLIFCTTVPPVAAQEASVPAMISYQGKLVQANGSPYADGNHHVTFKLYDAPTGGTLIWGLTYEVPVVNGLFSVALGAPGGQELDPRPPVMDLRFAFGSPDRYLELTVAGTALLPRQQMTSVPYAAVAQTAVNGVPTGTVVAFAGSGDAGVPPGWAICDGASRRRDDPAYAALFQVIRTNHGAPDAQHFNLPDYRGRFLRGVASGPGGSVAHLREPDRAARIPMNPGGLGSINVGSVQEDTIQNITGKIAVVYFTVRDATNAGALTGSRFRDDQGALGDSFSIPSTQRQHGIINFDASNSPGMRTAVETRPKNAYVNYIIKL